MFSLEEIVSMRLRRIFFCMNQHFRKQNIFIPNELMQYILEEYPKEIHIAKRILNMLSSKMDIVSTQEDLIPLTIYIRSLLNVSFPGKDQEQ